MLTEDGGPARSIVPFSDGLVMPAYLDLINLFSLELPCLDIRPSIKCIKQLPD